MKLYLNRVGRTKIIPPQPRVMLVHRQRLLDTLVSASANTTLTLLSAPAGSGKTTLLVSLVQANPSANFLWLALDESDNDPAQFFTLLLAALEAQQPNSTARTQMLLEGMEQFNAMLVLNALINDVMDAFPGPFTLLMDDVHHLSDPALLKSLDYLLERVPAQMHVLMAGRYPPALALARLRARRQLAEFRLEDISFSPEEMQEFFQYHLRLPLRDEIVGRIHQLTQGWAAGVALFGSSMEQARAGDLERSFAPLLAQTNRHVFEFLTEEIINQEAPETRAFLLKTSVLMELNAQNCADLTGLSEQAAVALLEDLYHRNIFLTLLAPGTYRFHDLFAAFLLERLEREMPGQVRDLYRRAAQQEASPRQRTALFARAEDWDAAVHAIEQDGDALLAHGSYSQLMEMLNFLPGAQRARHTSLLFFEAICANQTWNFTQARDLLRQVVARMEQEDKPERLGTALLSLATCLSSTGDFAGAREAMEKAFACPLQPQQVAHLRIASAWQNLAQGNPQAANEDLDAMLMLLEQESSPAALRVIAPQWHYLFVALPGGTHRVMRYVQCCAAFAGDELLRASALAQSGWWNIWKGNWAQAKQDAAEAASISQSYGGLLWIDTDAGVLLPLLDARAGISDHHAVRMMEEGFQRVFSSLEQPQAAALAETWMPVYQFSLGHSYWMNDHLDEARGVLQRMNTAPPSGWQALSMLPLLLDALLRIENEEYDRAEVMLLECLERQKQYQFTRSIEDVAILLAYLAWRQGKYDRALEFLTPELDRCEREELPGGLLWSGNKVIVPLLRLAISRAVHPAFARRVLRQALPSEAGALVPETGEQLTPREEEVLRCIAGGASNAEVARQLVISIHTVKIHVARILAKLDVDSRQAAANRARDLGIL